MWENVLKVRDSIESQLEQEELAAEEPAVKES